MAAAIDCVLMRHSNDCEVAVIATACHIPYEKAAEALGYGKLPKQISDPIIGNPINLYKALISLGFWKKNITLTELLSGSAESGTTIVLIHNPQSPTMQQHWVIYCGSLNGKTILNLGHSKNGQAFDADVMTKLFTRGFPNCAMQIYKASAARIVYEKFKSKVQELYEKFRGVMLTTFCRSY